MSTIVSSFCRKLRLRGTRHFSLVLTWACGKESCVVSYLNSRHWDPNYTKYLCIFLPFLCILLASRCKYHVILISLRDQVTNYASINQKKKKKWPITPVFYDHPSNNLVLKINLVFYHYFKKMINWPNSDMRLCWFQGSNRQWRLWDYFLGEPIKNINYTKFKTKENLNILTLQKTKTEIHKILQLLSTMFHILKSLQNIFIINFMSYISFNVYSQAIIHLLISQLIDLFQNF